MAFWMTVSRLSFCAIPSGAAPVTARANTSACIVTILGRISLRNLFHLVAPRTKKGGELSNGDLANQTVGVGHVVLTPQRATRSIVRFALKRS